MFNTKLETRAFAGLEGQLNKNIADELHALYNFSVVQLKREVYPKIAERVKGFTDHGERHIISVQEHIDSLTGDSSLSCLELYLLCLMAAFHDVGNMFGRDEHEKHVKEIYDKIVPKDIGFKHLRSSLFWGCMAHGGKTDSGTSHTISTIPQHEIALFGAGIELPALAAILRFADELAEDEYRASQFMQQLGMLNEESDLHHWYSASVSPRVDLEKRRIALQYQIQVTQEEIDQSDESQVLRKKLAFMLQRIAKVQSEKRYTSAYSDDLARFRKLEITVIAERHPDGLPIVVERRDLTDTTLLPQYSPECDEVSQLLSEVTAKISGD